MLSGWGAWIRGDVELMLVRFAPDFHFEPLPDLVAAGMRTVYRGHAGFREWAADMREAWEGMDPAPQEIVDAGEVSSSSATFGSAPVVAASSSMSLSPRVYWSERGLIVRVRDFSNCDEALRKAGVPSTSVGSGGRRRVTSQP